MTTYSKEQFYYLKNFSTPLCSGFPTALLCQICLVFALNSLTFPRVPCKWNPMVDHLFFTIYNEVEIYSCYCVINGHFL